MSKFLDLHADGAGELIWTLNDVEVARLDSSLNITTKGSVNGGSISAVFDAVGLYGADNTGTTDSTTAIQNALNAAHTAGGGTVWIPRGSYKINASLVIYSNSLLWASRARRGRIRPPRRSGLPGSNGTDSSGSARVSRRATTRPDTGLESKRENHD